MIPPILVAALGLGATSLATYFCYVTHKTAVASDEANGLRWLGLSVGAGLLGSFIGAGLVAYVIRTRETR